MVITESEIRELAAMREAGVRVAEFHANGTLAKVEFRDPEPPPPEKQAEPQGSGFVDEVDDALGRLATRGKKPA